VIKTGDVKCDPAKQKSGTGTNRRNVKCQTSNVKRQMSNVKRQMSNVKRQM